jgi:hypothetical protein
MADQVNAHIHFSPEAPHRLRRAADRERREIRLKLWEMWINLSADGLEPFDALQQILAEHEELLSAWAIRRLGVRGVRT